MHFAPGLSDNAAFNLPAMPANAYLGLYIDGEGPSGIIRDLPANETAYFRFLPMIYPYLIKEAPDTFVVQFGGGISTAVALKSDSKSVTVAEGNPAVLGAFRNDKVLRDFTGDILDNPKLKVIDYEGRLYPRQHHGPLRHRRPEPRQLCRPVEPRRLRHRREVRLLARGHDELHARAETRAASCRSRCGTRRSRPSRC